MRILSWPLKSNRQFERTANSFGSNHAEPTPLKSRYRIKQFQLQRMFVKVARPRQTRLLNAKTPEAKLQAPLLASPHDQGD